MNQTLLDAKWFAFSINIVKLIRRLVVLLTVYLGIACVVLVIAAWNQPTVKDQLRYLHRVVLNELASSDSTLSEHEFANIFSPFNNTNNSSDESDSNNPKQEASLLAAQTAHDDATNKGFFAYLTVDTSQFSVPGVPQQKAVVLRDYVARKFKVARSVTGALIRAVYTVAKEKDLDPLLMLGVIAIESRYNPFAESHVGAQGLMQVMPVVHEDKFVGEYGGNLSAINPIANIRAGGQILHDCIKRRGSVDGGLGCYVGAIGANDGGYAAKVQSERRALAIESGIALGINLGKYR